MSNEDKQSCKIFIFSDIHYASKLPIDKSSKTKRKLTHHALALVNKLIDIINDKMPDLAINLGDLIEDSKNHDTDLRDFNYIWKVLKNIKVPFYSTIGNHDLRSMTSKKEIEQIMGYESATYSINLNGYHFVFLGLEVNNQLNATEGGILKTRFVPDEDIEWLKKDLVENQLPCLIFNHYGIAEDSMKNNFWFENNPNHALLSNRQQIKNILARDGNIIAVFSGHQHWTKKLSENGLDFYVIGSLTEDINDDGIPDGVYFEVDLYGNNVNVIEHHLKLD